MTDQNPITLYRYVTGGRPVDILDREGVYDVETIRKHLAGTFAELANATADTDDTKQTVTVDGSDIEVDRVVTFSKKVGTKGAHPIIAQLVAVPPAHVEALVLLDELLTVPLAPTELLSRQPEIEAATDAIQDLTNRSQKVISRCLQLTPKAAPTVPPGF